MSERPPKSPRSSSTLSRGALSPDRSSRVAGWLLLVLLTTTLLFGGASRADVVSLAFLRPIAAFALVIGLYQFLHLRPKGFGWPTFFLCLYTAYVAIQLVPLPPDIWRNLPGRAPLFEALDTAGISGIWQPISVLPVATFNSLGALFVPLAAFLLFSCASLEFQRRALLIIGAFALASVALGLLQMLTGEGGGLYPFRVTNTGAPVGLLANRNHAAALSAAAIPLVFCLAETLGSDKKRQQLRWAARIIALGLALFAAFSGSRMGTVLAFLSLVASVLVFTPPGAAKQFLRGPAWIKAAGFGGSIAAIALVVFTVINGAAFTRFAQKDSFADLRFEILPDVVAMIRDGMPWGWGYGTFPEVYEFYERTENIVPSYINHAHNDWLEVIVEGGIVSGGIILCLVLWGIKQCWRQPLTLLRPSNQFQYRRSAALLGICTILFASLTDYPLRTPTAAIVLAVFLGFLVDTSERQTRRARG